MFYLVTAELLSINEKGMSFLLCVTISSIEQGLSFVDNSYKQEPDLEILVYHTTKLTTYI